MDLGYPDIKVSEISKRMQVTSPTVTQLVKSLEAHGLVERNNDLVDRRSVGVRLTEKGEEVARQALETFLATMSGLIEYLGEEQSEQFIELLLNVSRYFREREADMLYFQGIGDDEA
ncbi:hypothetical protein KDI_11150 [Dictyobacter arantiisoli]|uniref:HTH marR-type domain-containing protein n=2 Tax=Dictyobacter arantiisoli TaxID=2014874 RepID=A0A5A5T7W5_9CHLR|nr:hypothetical protein KDI_11150 [Dictyobacter arantiisoli]